MAQPLHSERAPRCISPEGVMARFSVVALLCSLPALAAQPSVTDAVADEAEAPSRCAPALVCTAKLAVENGVSVEAGSDGRGGDGELVHAGQMVVKYTLAPRLEFQVYSNTLILAGAAPRSAEAVQPGLKVSLLDETELGPAYDLSVHLTMPGADPTATWDLEAWAYLSKTVGALKADLCFMFAMTNLAAEPAAQGLGMLTLVTDLGGGVNLFSELYGTWGATQLMPPGAGVFGGVSVAATDELLVDVGAEVGFHEAGRYTFFAGVTWVPGSGGGDARPQPRLPPGAVARLDAY